MDPAQSKYGDSNKRNSLQLRTKYDSHVFIINYRCVLWRWFKPSWPTVSDPRERVSLTPQQKRKKKKEKSFDLKRTEVHIWSRSDGSGQQKSLQCDQFCFVSWFLLLIAAVWSSISNQKNTMCPNTFCCIHMIVEFFFSGGLMEVT